MRSVSVVLPESMWALIPMFLTFDSSTKAPMQRGGSMPASARCARMGQASRAKLRAGHISFWTAAREEKLVRAASWANLEPGLARLDAGQADDLVPLGAVALVVDLVAL